MHVNKYDLAWQIVRMTARKEKRVERKIRIVTQFFMKNKSAQNAARVLNWAHMTKLGYRGEYAHKFISLEVAIRAYAITAPLVAECNDFNLYPKETLRALLKDLKGRKWSFQFKQAPKDHIEFVRQLEEAINGKEEV